MYKYIIWKTITSFFTLIIVVIMFYFLMVSFRSSPFDLNNYKDMDEYNAVLAAHGIDKPTHIRFISYIKGVFQGDWGHAYHIKYADTIPQLFFKPLNKSILVMIPSYFIGMALGLFLGYWSGYRRGKIDDIIINAFVTFFIAIPSFVIASFALVSAPLFGLPSVFQDVALPNVTMDHQIRSLIMPILVMTMISLAGWQYLTRIEVSRILKENYILSAKTRGFSKFTIFRKYVWRNSIYPFISGFVTSFMVVFNTSLIVERFFNVPGSASLLLAASKNGEINILMFNLLFFSSISIFLQIIADIAQFSINPIVRAQFHSKTSPVRKLEKWIQRHKNLPKKIVEMNND